MGYGSMNGIPMVAGSPGTGTHISTSKYIFSDKNGPNNDLTVCSVRQDSPMGMSPVDISGKELLTCLLKKNLKRCGINIFLFIL